MKTLSVTEVARNFGNMLERMEHNQEEIVLVLVRDQRTIARHVPEGP